MSYQGPARHITYPDESSDPCVLEYRIVFTDVRNRLAVVQMFDPPAPFQAPSVSANVRDQILNRILYIDLRGLPLNSIRLVVSSGAKHEMYDIEVDVDDYMRRGNPYEASPSAATGARVREPISISAAAIIAARTRVQTIHATPKPLTVEVAEAIA